jgi:DNA-binding MarR family transcriptional regulator
MKLVKVSENERENSKKWGNKAMALGYVQIPSLLIQRQRELGLDSVSLNIVLQLATYWWRKDDLPYPSKKTLADALHLDESTIRRRIAALEKTGYLIRERRSNSANGQMSNRYNLSGLIKKLEPLVRKEAEEREAKQTSKGRRSLKVLQAQAMES